MNLKELAKKGFRTKEIVVPEWDDASVTIREPMHIHFHRYITSIDGVKEDEDLTDAQKDDILIKAEAKLFITVLLDENKNQVFSDDDLESLYSSYGPVHTRLLNWAVELMQLGAKPIEAAEKK